MIQEFHISITPVREDEYLVRTEQVAPGVPLAEEQFHWPVEVWLAEARQMMDDPLLNLLQGHTADLSAFANGPVFPGTRSGEASSQELASHLIALGQQLHNALFQGTIRDSWMTAQGVAYHRREILRLRLGLKGNRLPRLPWEVLYAGTRPIATGTDVVFSRFQPALAPRILPFQLPGQRVIQRSESGSLIKILVVIAAPTDQESLSLKREVLHLQEELQKHTLGTLETVAALPEIQLVILSQPDREQLTQALEQGQYDVFHYAGHSNLSATGGHLYLVNRKTGLTETLSGDDLAGLLVNNGIRLAVFNSCRGVDTATMEPVEDTRERNLAAALIKRGIPGVLAMAERIPDDVALTLTRLFYRNLRQGYPVDLSLNRARQGLVSAYGSHQLYWALPVLYLHPEFNGYLSASDRLPDLVSPTTPALEAHPALNHDEGTAIAEPPPRTASVIPFPKAKVTAPRVQSLGHSYDSLYEDAYGGDGLADIDGSFSSESVEPHPLGDLVDRLEYDNPLTDLADPQEVSDLVRQLSYTPLDPDLATDEPLLSDPSSESLLPQAETEPGRNGLQLPENPRYRQEPAELPVEEPELNLEDQLQSFNKMHWQVKEVTQARTVPFAEWRTAFAKQVPLPAAIANPTRKPTTRSDRTASDPASSTRTPSVPDFSLGSGPALHANLRQRQSNSKPLVIWSLLVAAGASISIGLGSWLLSQIVPSPANPPVATSRSPNSSPKATQAPQSNSPTTQVQRLTAAATQNFRQGAIAPGVQAVEALLNQGQLDAAETALSSVSPEQLPSPPIQFLKGRLAVQWVKSGKPGKTWADAKSYFEAAVAATPTESPEYLNALGFAAYASGDSERSEQAWYGALSALDKQGVTPPTSREDYLTAQAGLALVLLKSAARNPDDLQSVLVQRQDILTANPQAFQPERLRQNWMWSPQAIADWQKVLSLNSAS